MANDYTSLLLILLPWHDDFYTVLSLMYFITLLWYALSPMPLISYRHSRSPRTQYRISSRFWLSLHTWSSQPPSLLQHCNNGTSFDTTTHTIKLCSWYWRLWPSHATTKSGILYSTHDNNLTSVLPTVPDTLRDDAYDEFTPCWITSIIGPVSSLIRCSKWWYLSHSGTGPEVSNEG